MCSQPVAALWEQSPAQTPSPAAATRLIFLSEVAQLTETYCIRGSECFDLLRSDTGGSHILSRCDKPGSVNFLSRLLQKASRGPPEDNCWCVLSGSQAKKWLIYIEGNRWMNKKIQSQKLKPNLSRHKMYCDRYKEGIVFSISVCHE